MKLWRIECRNGVVFSAILAVACSDPNTPAPIDVLPRRGVTGISISPPTAALSVGDTLRIRAVVTLGNSPAQRDTTITWASSRPGVALVDSLSGLVRAFAPGVTTVTATLRADVNFRAATQLSVIP